MAGLAKAVALLEAGDWRAAHAIAQADRSALGSWAHGIAHLMEGDVANAGYWYRRAGRELPDAGRIAAEIAVLKTRVPAAAGTA